MCQQHPIIWVCGQFYKGLLMTACNLIFIHVIGIICIYAQTPFMQKCCFRRVSIEDRAFKIRAGSNYALKSLSSLLQLQIFRTCIQGNIFSVQWGWVENFLPLMLITIIITRRDSCCAVYYLWFSLYSLSQEHGIRILMSHLFCGR